MGRAVVLTPGKRRGGVGRVLALAGLLVVMGCTSAESGGQDAKATAKEPSACSLLNTDDVRMAFGELDTFAATRPDAVDGKRPWGCTWGNRTAYASVREIDRAYYRAGIKAPGARVIPQNMGKGDSFAVYPADEDEPMWFVFTVGSRYFKLEVVPSRDGDYLRYQQGDIGADVLRLLVPAMDDSLT